MAVAMSAHRGAETIRPIPERTTSKERFKRGGRRGFADVVSARQLAKEIIVSLDLPWAIELQRRIASVHADLSHPFSVAIEEQDLFREVSRVPWARQEATVILPGDRGHLREVFDRSHIRPTRGQNAIELARDNVASHAHLQRYDEYIRGSEGLFQFLDGLVGEEPHVVQAQSPSQVDETGLLDALAHEDHLNT